MKKSRFKFYAEQLKEVVVAEAFQIYGSTPAFIVEMRLGNLPVKVTIATWGSKRHTWRAHLGKEGFIYVGRPKVFTSAAKAFADAVKTASEAMLEIRLSQG